MCLCRLYGSSGAIGRKVEQLEAQQTKFQQDISATLQAILAASQMTDIERAAAEETRRAAPEPEPEPETELEVYQQSLLLDQPQLFRGRTAY